MKNYIFVLVTIFLIYTNNVISQELVKDINLSGDSEPYRFIEFNDLLYFVADDGVSGKEIWKTDGSYSGTSLLIDININGSSYPKHFFEFDGKLYFSADDGVTGSELWVTDGTGAGTNLVRDINIYNLSFNASSNPSNFIEYNNKIFFNANDGINGSELWVSDGTYTGTHLYYDINSNGSSNPNTFFKFNNMLFFNASDSVLNNGNLYHTFWRTDGTNTLRIINHQIFSRIVFNNKIIYSYGHLYETDGNIGGETLLKILNDTNGSSPKDFKIINDKLYFNAFGSLGGIHYRWEPHISDGTPSGTHILKDILPVYSSLHPNQSTYFTRLNDSILLFVARTSSYDFELWRSNGTLSETDLVKDIYYNTPGDLYPRGSYPKYLIAYDNLMYFTASDTTGEVLFYKSDGTENGTEKISSSIFDLHPLINPNFYIYKGELFFQANIINKGKELCKLKLNNIPIINEIDNKIMCMDEELEIELVVSDIETNNDSLKIIVESSNTSLIDSNSISITGSDTIRLITFTPNLNQTGSTHITISVKDEVNLVSTTQFEIIVDLYYNVIISENNFELNTTLGFQSYEWFLDGVSLNEYSDNITATENGIYTVEIIGFNGCKSISDGFIINNVSTNDYILEQKIVIYPNPSEGFFNIELQDINIDYFKILNIQGKILEEIPVNNYSLIINLYDYPKGLYLLEFISDSYTIKKQILNK